ncbi:MAG: hypothetical protein ACYCXI_00965 [Dethiobacteraceae bacterium]
MCRKSCRLRHNQKDENAPQLALTLALSRRERGIAGMGAVGANLRVRPVALPQGEGISQTEGTVGSYLQGSAERFSC